MCEFMHQTYVARPVDLSRFVIVRIDRYCVCYAFAIQASLLCRLQELLVVHQEDEDSRSNCGEPHQVVELLFAGEPTPVLHLDSDVVEVLVLVHLFLVVAAMWVMVDPGGRTQTLAQESIFLLRMAYLEPLCLQHSYQREHKSVPHSA